jgi:hypothetical protein
MLEQSRCDAIQRPELFAHRLQFLERHRGQRFVQGALKRKTEALRCFAHTSIENFAAGLQPDRIGLRRLFVVRDFHDDLAGFPRARKNSWALSPMFCESKGIKARVTHICSRLGVPAAVEGRRMSEFHVLLVIAFGYVVWRLDRIGRQIEAVNVHIRVEIAELLGNEERARETLRDWKESKMQVAKDTLQMLIFWGVIVALYVGWQVIKSHY